MRIPEESQLLMFQPLSVGYLCPRLEVAVPNALFWPPAREWPERTSCAPVASAGTNPAPLDSSSTFFRWPSKASCLSIRRLRGLVLIARSTTRRLCDWGRAASAPGRIDVGYVGWGPWHRGDRSPAFAFILHQCSGRRNQVFALISGQVFPLVPDFRRLSFGIKM